MQFCKKLNHLLIIGFPSNYFNYRMIFFRIVDRRKMFALFPAGTTVRYSHPCKSLTRREQVLSAGFEPEFRFCNKHLPLTSAAPEHETLIGNLDYNLY